MASRHSTLLVSIATFVSLAGCAVGSPVADDGEPSVPARTDPAPSATTTRAPAAEPSDEFVDDPVRLAEWAGRYCTAVAPLNERLAEFDALVADSAVDELVATLATGLVGMDRAYADAAAAAARAGVPPIEGGVEIHDTIASTLSATSDIYADMARELATMAAGDTRAIGAVLDDARPRLRVERKALVAAFERRELYTAFRTAPACATASGEVRPVLLVT